MHAHVMARLSIVAMATLAISTDMATPTTDQSGPVASDTCRIVRMQPAGMLMTCPPRLRSIWLTMDALNRTLRFTPDGVFHFTSPIMEMCSQQPDIYGWIITKENWQSSSQDGSAIAEILQQPPAVRGPNDRAANAIPKSLDSVCGTFLLDVAGIEWTRSLLQRRNVSDHCGHRFGARIGFRHSFSSIGSRLGEFCLEGQGRRPAL